MRERGTNMIEPAFVVRKKYRGGERTQRRRVEKGSQG